MSRIGMSAWEELARTVFTSSSPPSSQGANGSQTQIQNSGTPLFQGDTISGRTTSTTTTTAQRYDYVDGDDEEEDGNNVLRNGKPEPRIVAAGALMQSLNPVDRAVGAWYRACRAHDRALTQFDQLTYWARQRIAFFTALLESVLRASQCAYTLVPYTHRTHTIVRWPGEGEVIRPCITRAPRVLSQDIVNQCQDNRGKSYKKQIGSDSPAPIVVTRTIRMAQARYKYSAESLQRCWKYYKDGGVTVGEFVNNALVKHESSLIPTNSSRPNFYQRHFVNQLELPPSPLPSTAGRFGVASPRTNPLTVGEVVNAALVAIFERHIKQSEQLKIDYHVPQYGQFPSLRPSEPVEISCCWREYVEKAVEYLRYEAAAQAGSVSRKRPRSDSQSIDGGDDENMGNDSGTNAESESGADEWQIPSGPDRFKTRTKHSVVAVLEQARTVPAEQLGTLGIGVEPIGAVDTSVYDQAVAAVSATNAQSISSPSTSTLTSASGATNRYYGIPAPETEALVRAIFQLRRRVTAEASQLRKTEKERKRTATALSEAMKQQNMKAWDQQRTGNGGRVMLHTRKCAGVVTSKQAYELTKQVVNERISPELASQPFDEHRHSLDQIMDVVLCEIGARMRATMEAGTKTRSFPMLRPQLHPNAV